MNQTEYTHTVTIAAPSTWIDGANSLAALMGQNPEGDMRTFRAPRYTKDGVEYAVTHAVIKDVFLEPTQTGQLPPDPADEMPVGYSRTAAEDAFASINTEGGILMVVDVDPHVQFAEWGLEPKPSEDIISVNNSTAERLTDLSGVGDSLAQDIIDGRPWDDLYDLSGISGISDAMVDDWIQEGVISL